MFNPLVKRETAEKLGITLLRHSRIRPVENYTGEVVAGAGQFFTEKLRLQHRKHYTQEVFEISPMDMEVYIFLPFRWISTHPPQGAWEENEVRFNSARCLEECTKYETNGFSLTWDESVSTDPTAHLIGYVATVDEGEDPLKQVPLEFHQYLRIMGKEAADALPEHRPYDCKIELKEGSTAPRSRVPIFSNSNVVGALKIKHTVPTSNICVVPCAAPYTSVKPDLVSILGRVFGSSHDNCHTASVSKR